MCFHRITENWITNTMHTCFMWHRYRAIYELIYRDIYVYMFPWHNYCCICIHFVYIFMKSSNAHKHKPSPDELGKHLSLTSVSGELGILSTSCSVLFVSEANTFGVVCILISNQYNHGVFVNKDTVINGRSL